MRVILSEIASAAPYAATDRRKGPPALRVLVLCAVMVLASGAPARAATFGRSAVGGTTDNSGYAGFLGATRFTSPADCGTLTDLAVYSANATGADICISIYSDAAGYPGIKIAQGCGPTGLPWGVVPVSASLSPNTDYWLVFGDGDGGYSYHYDAGAAGQFVRVAGSSYPTHPAAFPGGGTSFSREYSVYATYTPAGTCVVSSTADTGAGSLRQCITDANATPGTNVVFDIPDTAPGYTTSGGRSWWRISPASALPTITASGTVIDGATQAANYGSDTNNLGPEIQIDGSGAGAGVDGLTVNVPGGAAAIRQLVLTNFSRDGIRLQGGGSLVAGNYIGLAPDGDTPAGNNTSSTALHGGIRVESAGNTIGGTAAADRNVVSGNTLAGIVINGAGATGNQVLGNYIGTDATGTLDRGNLSDGEGIEIQLAGGNTIGGTTAAARNVISGNASDGIEIDGADNNVVQGNYIGTDRTGTVLIPNDRDGIDINSDLADGATGNLIGGTAAGAGNLIRGNTLNGVELRDDTVAGATTNNSILGNLIYDNGQLGIDLEPAGITLNDAADGDTGVNGLQNWPVITSAVSGGVFSTVSGTLNSTPGTTFQLEFFATATPDPLGHGEAQSFLGTTTVTTDGAGDASFTVSLPAPLGTGDYVTATATGPEGTSEFAANYREPSGCPTVITTDDSGPGSLRACIAYANSNAGTTIVFDIPDTAPGYTTSGGRSWWRISPANALPAVTAPGTVIDGATQAANYGSQTNGPGPEIQVDGNATSPGVDGFTFAADADGSQLLGLMVTRFKGDGVRILDGADGITVADNWIGTDGSGAATLGNTDDGIEILGAANAIDGNVIVNSGDEGINLTGAGATGNVITGNIIGLEPDGSTGSGNGDVGIALLPGAAGNTIGGLTAAERNIISMNFEGIEINTADNIVRGNYIGTDATGTLDRGNRNDDGVEVQGGGNNNAIGGTVAGAGNLIAYNLRHGVTIKAGTGNRILGNIIHSNDLLGIDLNGGGVNNNDSGDGDTGPNDLQNYPVITASVTNGVTTTVTGTLDSQPSTDYWLEFYTNFTPDPTWNGEAEAFLGTTTVTTDAGGMAAFTVTLPAPLPPGAYVTATATDPAGNTSEFAENFIETPSTCPTVTRTADEGVSTLRECLTLATASPGTTIAFDIPDTDPGYITSGGDSWWRIAVVNELPEVTAPGTVIDGSSQTLNRGDTNSLGPEIEIVSGGSSSKSGLILKSANNAVNALVIGGFGAVNGNGIEITGPGATGNTVTGNYLGTDHSGRAANANQNGIYIGFDAASNTIGGTAPGEGNILAFNASNGIWINDDDSDFNRVSGNSIFANGGLGLDLKNKGVTVNDPGDTDTGPNEELNYPVLSGVVRSGTGFVVTGSVGAGNTVQFFRANNPASPAVVPDPSGYGEGYRYIATASPLTEGGAADGDPAVGTFRFTLPGSDLSSSDSVSSTAIDPTGNTSEFGENVEVPLYLVKRAYLASDGTPIANSSTLPRGTVFQFLIYTDNSGAGRTDVSIRDVLDPAFAYSAGSLKVDNSVASGATVGAIYTAVAAASPLTDIIDADVASVSGSTIDVGNRYVANGRLDIAAGRVWALLFTVKMQ